MHSLLLREQVIFLIRFLTTFFALTGIDIDILGTCKLHVGTPPRAVSRHRRDCDVKKLRYLVRHKTGHVGL